MLVVGGRGALDSLAQVMWDLALLSPLTWANKQQCFPTRTLRTSCDTVLRRDTLIFITLPSQLG